MSSDELGIWIAIGIICYGIYRAQQKAKDGINKIAQNERARNIGLTLLEKWLGKK
jgi:hypothetical protein